MLKHSSTFRCSWPRRRLLSSSDDTSSTPQWFADTYSPGIAKQASDSRSPSSDSQFTERQACDRRRSAEGHDKITVQRWTARRTRSTTSDVTLALFMPDHGHGSAAKPIGRCGRAAASTTSRTCGAPHGRQVEVHRQVNQSGALKTTTSNYLHRRLTAPI